MMETVYLVIGILEMSLVASSGTFKESSVKDFALPGGQSTVKQTEVYIDPM
jgi:hypothetical protein